MEIAIIAEVCRSIYETSELGRGIRLGRDFSKKCGNNETFEKGQTKREGDRGVTMARRVGTDCGTQIAIFIA